MLETCPSLRRDEGVSPVIAVILLLAITVVLASVLYVVVSNLTPSSPVTKVPIGVNVEKAGNNWLVIVSSASTSLNTSLVYFEVIAGNGTTILIKTPLASLPYFQDNTPVGTLSAGDSIRLPMSQYPARSQFYISDSQSILWAGELA